MDPSAVRYTLADEGLPHPRGDGPVKLAYDAKGIMSPPPAWGWTRPDPTAQRLALVSPTRVGMDPMPS